MAIKAVFAVADVVISVATIHQSGASVSCSVPGAVEYDVESSVDVEEGYTVTVTAGVPAFTPPAPRFAALTPMGFYLAFTPAERIAIKTSVNPTVAEFWDTYQRAERTDTPIDPNLISVVEGLEYLAQPTSGSPPGAGILASAARIPQIQAGIAQ